jgi:hypothetical protein
MWVGIYLNHQIPCQLVGSKRKKNKGTERKGDKKAKKAGSKGQVFDRSVGNYPGRILFT